jgi:hypothetical protein
MPQLTNSASRINQLLSINNGQRYLEIGVAEGYTLNGVKAAIKFAVDPFMSDMAKSLPKDNISFFEESSDRFFERNLGTKFDVIFIDGLHTYDQTYRDLTNSLCMLARQGFILIDDVLPSVYFASWRNQSSCVRWKQRLKRLIPSLKPTFWMGDVYRVIPLINLFHPYLEYASFLSNSNAEQTLVFRKSDYPSGGIDQPWQQEGSVKNLHHKILQLEKADYFWLKMNKPLFHFCDEERIFAYLSALAAR